MLTQNKNPIASHFGFSQLLFPPPCEHYRWSPQRDNLLVQSGVCAAPHQGEIQTWSGEVEQNWQNWIRWFLKIALGGRGGALWETRWDYKDGSICCPWKIEQSLRGAGSPEVLFSHRLELVDALLRVALADLPQRFVFVSARLHVLGVQHVVLRLLGVVPGLGQLWTQCLRDQRESKDEEREGRGGEDGAW